MKKGHIEKIVERYIAVGIPEFSINWKIVYDGSIRCESAADGAADRITAALIKAGYRPDGSGVVESQRADYCMGRKVNGRYIRLPQETWRLDDDSIEAAALAEIDAKNRDMVENPDSYFEPDDPRRFY